MSELRKAAQISLEALDQLTDDVDGTGLSSKPSFDLSLDAIDALRAALAQPNEKFCDANCVWTDHHPDCALAQEQSDVQPEWDEVFDAAVYAWKARTPGRDALRLCFQDKSDDSEIFTHWTSRELMDFAARIATLYTAPPQRKPLTDDQIAQIDWKDGETLHDFARAIEAAHGIGG